jgi:hypothetical protein
MLNVIVYTVTTTPNHYEAYVLMSLSAVFPFSNIGHKKGVNATEISSVPECVISINNTNNKLSSNKGVWRQFLDDFLWLPKSIVSTTSKLWHETRVAIKNSTIEMLKESADAEIKKLEGCLGDAKAKLVLKIGSLLGPKGVGHDCVEEIVEAFLRRERERCYSQFLKGEITDRKMRNRQNYDDELKISNLEIQLDESEGKCEKYSKELNFHIEKMGSDLSDKISEILVFFLKKIAEINSSVVLAGTSWSTLTSGISGIQTTLALQARLVFKNYVFFDLVLNDKPPVLSTDVCFSLGAGPRIGWGALEDVGIQKEDANFSVSCKLSATDRIIISFTFERKADGYELNIDKGCTVTREQLFRYTPLYSLSSHQHGIQFSTNYGVSCGKEIYSLNKDKLNLLLNLLLSGSAATVAGMMNFFLLLPDPAKLAASMALGDCIGALVANRLFPASESVPAAIEVNCPGLAVGKFASAGLGYAASARLLGKVKLD